MKLGRPKSYTLFNQPANHHHTTTNFGGIVAVNGGLTFLSPCRGKTYRHMKQVLMVLMVFCTILLCQISLMAIQSADVKDETLSNAIGGNSCESCDDAILLPNVPSNQNSIVGTDSQQDSHLSQADFALGPETSANYLYNDDNYEVEIETTKSSGSGDGSISSSSNNNINITNGQVQLPEDSNDMSKSGGEANLKVQKSSSSVLSVKNSRRNKHRENSHYQKRKKLLESVFLSVKTTKRFHSTRLEPILRTWFNLAREQTWIFTDADDPLLDRRTNGHIINTHCPSTHNRQALCCKMSAEFDTFIQSQKSWFCHFDDDNYVNVPALLDLLSRYDPKEYWYLGKPSLKNPIHFLDPDNKSEEVSFWFGTGGAGFCLSRALGLRMSPLARGGKFMSLCDKIQLPDDVTIGYVAGHLLSQNLTVIPQFHSHFETMKFIDMKNPHPEISFSYVRYGGHVNILDVKGFFTEEEDPTRFLSLHCLLFPNFSFCPKGSASKNR